ncbi:hypothetical protein BCR35DRAFT_353302 [Leucosporidium creatinivorum]|uniref:Proteophosphoglycan ppg4 n=1 Tax=Leucosporidium creatinivorum TaxID=106004 RepID=A0A1Y2F0Q9_9BASI|nr:hypothetical protein BCR35DRAFT_353302 [Leucosporidium creatinivorum]
MELIQHAAVDDETRQDTLSSLALVHSSFRQHAFIYNGGPFHRHTLREALAPASRKTSKAHWIKALEGLRSVRWNLWESYWGIRRNDNEWREQYHAENKLYQHTLVALKRCTALRKIVVENIECPGAGDELYDALSLLPELQDVEFTHPDVDYYEARSLPNVTTFTASFNHNGPWYPLFARDLPKVQCLIWVGPDLINHFGFADIAPHLQALALGEGNRLDEELYYEKEPFSHLQLCTSLQHFFYDFEPERGDLSLALAALPSIRTLRLGDRGEITPLQFAKLIAVPDSPLQRLERLTIRAGHPLEGWLEGKEAEEVRKVLGEVEWDPSTLWVEVLPKLAAGEEEVVQKWRP